MYKFFGEHAIIDFKNSTKNEEFLKDPSKLKKLIENIAKEINATLLSVHIHEFGNGGLSGIGILQESHISIHTYPEYKGMMMDVFTCGEIAKPSNSIQYVINYFQPQIIDTLILLTRGEK